MPQRTPLPPKRHLDTFSAGGFPSRHVKPERCEFCGASPAVATRDAAQRRRCVSCTALAAPLFTLEHARHGAREVMINQHAGEPRRKLLELPCHSIVVFLSDRLDIIALEIETKAGDRVLRWSRAGNGVEYVVSNVGKNYSNNDEMIASAGFDRDRLRHDIALSRANLRPPILAALELALGA